MIDNALSKGLSVTRRIRDEIAMSKIAILLLVVLLFFIITEPSQAGHLSLASQKHDVTIRLRVPKGWEGGVRKDWPSYEIWSFSKGTVPNVSYLQIRIDPLKPVELDWNLATDAEIRKSFDDFANAEVERIATVAIENTRVLVWAAYHVDGHFLVAKLRRGNLKIAFDLHTERRVDLRRLRQDFIDVLKSVRILEERPSSSQ